LAIFESSRSTSIRGRGALPNNPVTAAETTGHLKRASLLICSLFLRVLTVINFNTYLQTCQEDDGRKDSSSDSELKISQQLLDQELQVHQERLIQLLDQGDNEIFVEQEAPILTADLSGICTLHVFVLIQRK